MKELKFNKNSHLGRDYGCIKLNFTPLELSQKPLKYWWNVGLKNRDSTLSQATESIKQISGNNWSNCVHNLYYYGGARVIHPFHMHFMKTYFEFTVYDPFGNAKNRLFISRKVKSDKEYFLKEEIEQIENYLKKHYEIIRKSYYSALTINNI